MTTSAELRRAIMSGGQNGKVDTALKLIRKWAPDDESALLSEAISSAYNATLSSLEADLAREHAPGLKKRHQELLALDVTNILIDPDRLPPDDLWRLLLSHLDPGQQQLLQKTYEDLREALEAEIICDEDDDANTKQAQGTLNALAVMEDVLAELPHTPFAPPSAPDDYDRRRRTLSIEIDRHYEAAEFPVLVEWLDGYQDCVAAMELYRDYSSAWWYLDIYDPPPGRTIQLELVGGVEGATLSRQGEEETLDPRKGARMQREGHALLTAAAERELQNAIAWGTQEIGDRSTVASGTEPAHRSTTATRRPHPTHRRRPG
jgi:hypothetical protein